MEEDPNLLKTKEQLIVELEISHAWVAALLDEANKTKSEQHLAEQRLAIQLGVAQILATSLRRKSANGRGRNVIRQLSP